MRWAKTLTLRLKLASSLTGAFMKHQAKCLSFTWQPRSLSRRTRRLMAFDLFSRSK
jgi:hypothetical protein